MTAPSFPPSLTGQSFSAPDVVAHYTKRPPYPAGVVPLIAERAPRKGRLLDLGSGEGKLARPLSALFDEVAAVDPSAEMIALGRSLERGDDVHWIEAKAEEAPLEGRFDVVSFATAIHWMDLPRLAAHLRPHLAPDYVLAIVTGDQPYDPPWAEDWRAFLARWVPLATGRALDAPEYRAVKDKHWAHLEATDVVDVLSDPFRQSIADFTACQHSRDTFAIPRLGAELEAFRSELHALLAPHADTQGVLTYRVKSTITFARFRPA